MEDLGVGDFDDEGNLNNIGQIHLGYLKAKCLCKLKRYSESLFQLAKIEQMTNLKEVLNERQQSKIMLYKAICMKQTKQYKQAV